jgi:hypothetical protein
MTMKRKDTTLSITHLFLRRAIHGLAVVALAAGLAACGSSKTSSTTAAAGTNTNATGASGAFGARRAALVACLKKHGVTLPNRPPGARPPRAGGGPPPGTPGTRPRGGFLFGGAGRKPSAKLQAAFKACGADFGRDRFARRPSQQTIQKYVTCVRQHGFNLPNPNFSGKGPVFPTNIRTNAKFQAASRACQSLLVPPASSSGGTGGSST